MFLFFLLFLFFIDIYLLSLRKFLGINMKRLFITLFFTMMTIVGFAQQANPSFVGYLTNDEFEIYLRIDFIRQEVTIPGQEIYGSLPGYLGKKHNSFCWPITSAKQTSDGQYTLTMVNDYGSEDLTATLTIQQDATYVLRQIEGSTLKVPKNGKWQKLPKTIVFKR